MQLSVAMSEAQVDYVFDAMTNGFVAVADASNDIPANAASGLSALRGFVPSIYYAVAVH